MKDGHLKDGTAGSRKDGNSSAVAGVGSEDLERGYINEKPAATPRFDSEDDGGTNEVGNPLTRGGFAGRPLGWSR
jgi:hypothetical protein